MIHSIRRYLRFKILVNILVIEQFLWDLKNKLKTPETSRDTTKQPSWSTIIFHCTSMMRSKRAKINF